MILAYYDAHGAAEELIVGRWLFTVGRSGVQGRRGMDALFLDLLLELFEGTKDEPVVLFGRKAAHEIPYREIKNQSGP